ncbi:50S ribosomal protein L23 [Haliscomenobacter sp.]|jgi:large subunit ribosomal protein L23|uniref:50S ribosomal protein L23 n=1 Tax=Haliscomenobacter sp. TaxID=2717303 RepID=UPI0035930A69
MAKKDVLIQPLITEKAERLSSTLNKYSFIVHRKANKVEIKKAVEAFYGVSVEAVNTLVVPGKLKSRSTRTGVVRGRVPAYKKAIVTLSEGENIDFFAEL